MKPKTMIAVAVSPGSSVLVGAPGDPSSGQRTPFGSPAVPGSPGTIYQPVYNSNNFLTPITITGLTFFDTQFPSTTITDADYRIHLSIRRAHKSSGSTRAGRRIG